MVENLENLGCTKSFIPFVNVFTNSFPDYSPLMFFCQYISGGDF